MQPPALRGRCQVTSPVHQRPLTRPRPLAVEPIRGGLPAARDAWQELAEQSAHPFATYEWAFAWWLRWCGRGTLRLLGCRGPDGRLAALVPLYMQRRGPLRIGRFVGHGPADELGAVGAPADRLEALAALRREMLSGRLRLDLLVAERVALTDGAADALGGTALADEPSPAIDISDLTWEEFLGARSRNFREQVRRRERVLRREHDLRYRLADDPERLDDDMATLAALHEARWGARGSGAFAGDRRAFHVDFARLALERGWLRLWFMELGGRPVAAWHGLRFAGREWYYQSGRDPAFDNRSVGFVLLAHTLREAIADGLDEYRMLRGSEAYKSRFATHDRPVRTNLLAHGAAGMAALRLVEAAGPGRGRLRRALARLAG